MKAVHPSYTFVASTKTITLTGLNIDQDQLLLIVNATRGVQYFNFADSSLRGTVTSGANTTIVLTDASTTGHSNSDALVIYYDDQASTQAVSGTVTANPGTGAFTVSGTVGLDANSLAALENITVTVGAAVSVSNFPASQTVAGTVTANVQGKSQSGTIYDLPVGYREDVGNGSVSVVVPVYPVGGTAGLPFSAANPIEARATVTVGNTVTIAGTVTANPTGTQTVAGTVTANAVFPLNFVNQAGTDVNIVPYAVAVGWNSNDVNFPIIGNGSPLPVQIVQSGYATSVTANIGNTVTIGSLPALTPQLPRVTFIDGSGTVTTANTAVTVFASSTTRSYLLVQVTTGSAFVNVGATATTVNGISLTAGQGYAWETTIPQGIVSLISTTTSSRYVAKQA